MGFPKELCQLALENISDKENIDEALDWIQKCKMDFDFNINFSYDDEEEIIDSQ